MSEKEVRSELAYMYGLHDIEVDEFEDFMEELEFHTLNITKVWFQKYLNVSPLQLVHDYFNKEILGQ